MKLSFEPTQASTWRGFVWLATFIIGVVMLFKGKDVTPLLLLATGIAGGLGMGVKDELKDVITPEEKHELKNQIVDSVLKNVELEPHQ